MKSRWLVCVAGALPALIGLALAAGPGRTALTTEGGTESRRDVVPQQTTVTLKDVPGWRLSKAVLTAEGTTAATAKGALTSDRKVRALAVSLDGSTTATFELTYSLFTPSRDLPGQKAGMTYLRGRWTLTSSGASEEMLSFRHSPGRMAGTLSAELPFDPRQDARTFSAALRVPQGPDGGSWGMAAGSFRGDLSFTGELSLAKVQPGRTK